MTEHTPAECCEPESLLLWGDMLQSLNHLLWPLLDSLQYACVSYWGAKNRIEYSRCGFTSSGWKGKITSLDVLAILFHCPVVGTGAGNTLLVSHQWQKPSHYFAMTAKPNHTAAGRHLWDTDQASQVCKDNSRTPLYASWIFPFQPVAVLPLNILWIIFFLHISFYFISAITVETFNPSLWSSFLSQVFKEVIHILIWHLMWTLGSHWISETLRRNVRTEGPVNFSATFKESMCDCEQVTSTHHPQPGWVRPGNLHRVACRVRRSVHMSDLQPRTLQWCTA